MIEFVCPHCKKTLRVPEQFLGQSGKCNHCGSAITILVAPPPLSGEAFDTPIPIEPEPQAEPIISMTPDDLKKAISEGIKAAKQEEYQQNLSIAQAQATANRKATVQGCIGCLGVFVAFFVFVMVVLDSPDKEDVQPQQSAPVATPLVPTPVPQPIQRPVRQYQEPVRQVPETQTVYITNSGEKYHRASCRYLRSSSIEISLNDARGRGYTACSVCKP